MEPGERNEERSEIKREEARMKEKRKLPRGIYPGKDGWYWIRYTDQLGHIHREKGSPILTNAKAALERRRDEVRSGRFFPEKVRARAVLFGQVAADYLALAKARKRSWRDDEDHLQALKTLNEVPITDLTPARLEAVISDLAEERKWAPATFNRYRTSLSGVFRYAIRAGKAQMNPCREIKKRAEENTRVRYLTADEEAALMEVVREEAPSREVEILVAIHSGMRRSEQYRTHEVPDGGLKWEHINFRAGVIRLPRSKSSKPRAIPMNSLLRTALASIPQRIDSLYVFETTDPGKWFREFCDRAKITNFTWHDLRHTFASRLVMAGRSLREIAELMGHSEITTTMRYAHLAPQYLADAVESLVQSPGETSTRTDTKTAAGFTKSGK
jgi:integrase